MRPVHLRAGLLGPGGAAHTGNPFIIPSDYPGSIPEPARAGWADQPGECGDAEIPFGRAVPHPSGQLPLSGTGAGPGKGAPWADRKDRPRSV